ncbi:hypothetical protein QN277_008996 [Acacia crassicarpa]|uniref:Uncharacterized protein n=1 Tax=Acacia crassicarpa TaxID=499986 RepID=A0AAE1ISK3_9FABA|nr:hypothetical protein QN277_008996 [Acacia crassicarpa]
MTSPDNVEDLENYLRSAATDGNWYEVLEMYKQNKQLRTAKITVTGDTVLHMAVSSGRDYDVQEMVELVCGKISTLDYTWPPLLPSRDENDDEKKRVLGARDDNGNNTALHLAASKGNVEMYKKIISGLDPLLIAKHNYAGETPLFMAALHGNRETFLWLYYGYMGIPGVS